MPLSTLILVGLATSVGLGERPPGLVAAVRLQRNTQELICNLDSTPKYTGRGWLAQAAADTTLLSGGGLAWRGGLEVTLRDGGIWRKTTMRARAGLRWLTTTGSVDLRLRADLASWPERVDQPTTIAEIDWRTHRGRWWLEVRQGVQFWSQLGSPGAHAGYSGVALVGYEVGR